MLLNVRNRRNTQSVTSPSFLYKRSSLRASLKGTKICLLLNILYAQMAKRISLLNAQQQTKSSGEVLRNAGSQGFRRGFFVSFCTEARTNLLVFLVFSASTSVRVRRRSKLLAVLKRHARC